MKVAVIGASGFVGQAVCAAFRKRNVAVIELAAPRLTVDLGRDISEHVAALPTSEFTESLQDATVVVNCAGKPDASAVDLPRLYGANAALPLYIARAAMDSGATRFIHVSSAVVQGRKPVLDESSAQPPGISPYADSKILGEQLLDAIPDDFVTIYRPPSVHAPDRRITRSLSMIARHGLGAVSGHGDAPSPQALLANVASAVTFLALSDTKPPRVVIHPWEGQTARSILSALGGREPTHVPPRLARAAVGLLYASSHLVQRLRPNVRRLEMMLFGQEQAPSWLTDAGWRPAATQTAWNALGKATRSRPRAAFVVASVASMVDNFLVPSLHILSERGYDVHVVCNFEHGNTVSRERLETLRSHLDAHDFHAHHIDFARNPLDVVSHLRAAYHLHRLYPSITPELIHCHTPTAAAITRIVALGRRARVLYTAHGFHFYRGAPLRNWLLWFPIEWLLAQFTDHMILLNTEDFELASRFSRRDVRLFPGVGVDLSRFRTQDPSAARDIRTSMGIAPGTPLLLSIGELSQRKNHEMALEALHVLTSRNWHYIIIGQGPLRSHIEDVVERLGLTDNVTLLGYREDTEAFLHATDIFLFPSRQEGLPVAVIEAMAAGVPVIGTNIRGTRDLIPTTPLLTFPTADDYIGFSHCIATLLESETTRQRLGDLNADAAQAYDISRVQPLLHALYSDEANR